MRPIRNRLAAALAVGMLAAGMLAAGMLAMGAAMAASGEAGASELDIQEVTSPGGITAWLVEDHSNPMLSLRFAFRGGMALDPPDRMGLANMVSTLLDEGAGPYDSETFRGKLEDNAIRLSFSAGRDRFSGALTTLTDKRDLAFELTHLALTEPRFEAEAIARMRAAILAGIRRNLGSPGWLARRNFNWLAFGPHPYGWPGRGSPETVEAITADDLRAFVGTRLARDRLHVAAVGDITAEELAVALDRIFGELPATGMPIEVPDTRPGHGGELFLLELPRPQSVLVAGHAGVDRADPDWYAAQLINYILGGGGMTSRLMEELRVARGLTYGIGTGMTDFDHADLWTVSTSTVNARMAESLDELREVWGEMAAEGPTEAELRRAKDYMIGSLPLALTSTRGISRLLLELQMEGLGRDYLDRRAARFESVSPAEARRVAAAHLDPDSLLTVIVGQPEGIAPDQRLKGPIWGPTAPESLLEGGDEREGGTEGGGPEGGGPEGGGPEGGGERGGDALGSETPAAHGTESR